MIAFTIKGAKYLIANKVEGSILLLKQILAWMKGQDKRFPTSKEVRPVTTGLICPTEHERLRLLALNVFTPI